MQKQISSVLLIAGTCIGAGMLALPIVLAKLGIIPSILIIVAIWLLNYYTSLVGVELNLQSERGLSLGELGKYFSGRGAQAVGEISVKLLSYAALTVYLSGISSIIQKLTEVYFGTSISLVLIETCVALFCTILLFFPIKTVSAVNNVAFIGLTVIFLILIGATITLIDYTQMPWFSVSGAGAIDVLSVSAIIFASFGYQLVLHTLRDYCGKDSKTLRKSVFYGSLIPAIVYILWAVSSLSVIFKSNPEFFVQTVSGQISAGDLVKELAEISGIKSFLVWQMSILAIFTSFLGVSLGLFGSLDLSLKKHVESRRGRRILSALLTIIPVYFVAAFVPNAFIKILGFAGVLLVIIGILLPIYLFFKANIKSLYLKELKKRPLIVCYLAGLVIMFVEIFINN